MWLWILIGLSIITKVHGFASGFLEQSCKLMSPQHERTENERFAPQTTEPPFEVLYQPGKKGEPITGTEIIGSLVLEACLSLSIFAAVVIHQVQGYSYLCLHLLTPLMNLKTIFQFLSGANNSQTSRDLCWRLERKAW